ncbi:cytochrome c oxidase subunit II [Domibacillus sp. DTU_2020_1001157_1_SI_ALB_TIR_016]|uniref:cytochrome c oxidase subunit II n=1 Tax=Domibacillus sp. DTU_2020_1001157_1_SI_ALB_TIR_016 TaxID=3077789 RepID=UPI0028E474FE|nr:cytochrome c oxidase subunit II [Domibacillus sp. DTU_2020_1001157_1_SI_ALB_TIR_016]WNS79835.1 cytochrome c oxidase subunit II [Domibacillus sp. DTU_2020_1001157_1_SI_ALB_TIR_016]
MKKKLTNWRLFTFTSLTALFLSGCGEPFLSTLTPAGEAGQTAYDLMLLSTWIMVGVVIVVSVLFAIAILKFRRKKDDPAIPKQVEGSHVLEMIWTIIPIILLIILAIPTVLATFDLADTKAMDKKKEDGTTDAMVVNVRANLYWWEFEYPNQKIITSQELVVPTDQKVYFNVKASDVKHSFWIPAAGGKIDTNVENVNQIWLEFDGEKAEEADNLFYGKCAELCGPSHALMDFKVHALPKPEFDQWVTAMQAIDAKAAEAKPEDPAAAAGQEIFNQKCLSCHAVTTADARPEAARTAPNLAGFGERERIAGILEHNEEELKNWISNPEEYKPGNKMTGTYGELSDQEADQLAAYLMSLKVE